jgi:hypothetical protein
VQNLDPYRTLAGIVAVARVARAACLSRRRSRKRKWLDRGRMFRAQFSRLLASLRDRRIQSSQPTGTPTGRQGCSTSPALTGF